MRNEGEETTVKKAFNWTAGYLKGARVYNATQGYKYAFKLSDTATSGLRLIDTTLGKRGAWIFRMDNPHPGASFEHININPKIAGMKDPHLPLPTGGVQMGKNVAKFCQGLNTVNKVVTPIAIGIEVIQTGIAIKQDVDNNSMRNTTKKLAEVAGGCGCGYGGAVSGAAIGTLILPGIGTIIGGLIGGIGGGIGGHLTASALTDTISDHLKFDIEKAICEKCKDKFYVRKYLGEKDMPLCPKCRRVMKLTLADHSISISSLLVMKPEDNFTKYVNKKKSFFSSVISTILEENNAAVIVFSPSPDSEIEFPQISEKTDNDVAYFSAISNTWNPSDVKALTDLKDFELSKVWFCILGPDNDQINGTEFFETLDKFLQNESNFIDEKYQCVGSILDGAGITWQNPDLDKVRNLLPKLKDLCLQHGFEWASKDRRNVKTKNKVQRRKS